MFGCRRVRVGMGRALLVRFAALAALLSLPGDLLANVPPPPGARHVWVANVFTIEEDYPEWEFWLVSTFGPGYVHRLPVTPSNPVRVPARGLNSEHPEWDYDYADIYAVPRGATAPFGDSSPPYDWFFKARGAVVLGTVDARGSVWFTDNRQEIEVTYRIEVGPGRLVEVSRNSGDPMYRWVRLVPCFLLPLGAVGLCAWGIRRAFARRREGAGPP
jgi:hypothetical protein